VNPPVQAFIISDLLTHCSVDEDARPIAAKYLSKYRPAFLEAANRATNGDDATSSANATPAIAT
jgi:symplekin